MLDTSSYQRGLVPVHWIALSLICLVIDYVTGPLIQFPIVYLAPISLASWYGGRRWGLALAFVLPLFRLSFTTLWDPPWTSLESSINAAIRMTVFASFAWLIDRTASQMQELTRLQVLEGVLGVCGVCKKIRDERTDTWQPLDAYVAGHPGEFQPCVCTACSKQIRDVVDRH